MSSRSLEIEASGNRMTSPRDLLPQEPSGIDYQHSDIDVSTQLIQDAEVILLSEGEISESTEVGLQEEFMYQASNQSWHLSDGTLTDEYYGEVDYPHFIYREQLFSKKGTIAEGYKAVYVRGVSESMSGNVVMRIDPDGQYFYSSEGEDNSQGTRGSGIFTADTFVFNSFTPGDRRDEYIAFGKRFPGEVIDYIHSIVAVRCETPEYEMYDIEYSTTVDREFNTYWNNAADHLDP